MKSSLKKILFSASLAGILSCSTLKADIIVGWENTAGDLVVSWSGNISNWIPTYQFSANLTVLQFDNGMHALNGPVDLNWTGSAFNWYTGPNLNSGGVMVGDSFGTSGISNWVYMPGSYAGQNISGYATWAGQGGLISNFNAGSRDLGFGSNDNIIFRAGSALTNSVPDSGSTAMLIGLGLLGFGGLRRRFAA
jgi:VPDSG-CTERM motif